MAFTHPTAQKLELLTQPTSHITPPPAYMHDPTLSTTIADFSSPSSDVDSIIESEPLSSIHLQINTPLHITGDHNLIAIDPSLSASKIALAVVQALREMSMGASGVPMIDEEGRPRPLKVEVCADVRVEGCRNVVGERAVVAAVTTGSLARRKGSEGGEESESGLGKRERDGCEDFEGRAKKVRAQ